MKTISYHIYSLMFRRYWEFKGHSNWPGKWSCFLCCFPYQFLLFNLLQEDVSFVFKESWKCSTMQPLIQESKNPSYFCKTLFVPLKKRLQNWYRHLVGSNFQTYLRGKGCRTCLLSHWSNLRFFLGQNLGLSNLSPWCLGFCQCDDKWSCSSWLSQWPVWSSFLPESGFGSWWVTSPTMSSILERLSAQGFETFIFPSKWGRCKFCL